MTPAQRTGESGSAHPYTCPNCGTVAPASGKYCPSCGQPKHEIKIPLRHLLGEILESTLHFDAKSLLTLRILLFHPGSLSLDYLAGRRQRYVAPVRLYIFTSFVFFFLATVTPFRPSQTESTGEKPANRPGVTITFQGLHADSLAGLTDTQIDSVLAARAIEKSMFNRYITRQLRRIATAGIENFNHTLVRQISTMMFMLMPVFGAMLYLLNRRRLLYAIEGMVMSIHLHTAFFIIITITMIAGWFTDTLVPVLGSPLVCFLFFIATVRNSFRQSWPVTLAKSALLGAIYILLLALFFMGTVFVTVVLF